MNDCSDCNKETNGTYPCTTTGYSSIQEVYSENSTMQKIKLNNYYTKTETDDLFVKTTNFNDFESNVNSKITGINNKVDLIDLNSYYTKNESDSKFTTKTTTTELINRITNLENSTPDIDLSAYYTKAQIDAMRVQFTIPPYSALTGDTVHSSSSKFENLDAQYLTFYSNQGLLWTGNVLHKSTSNYWILDLPQQYDKNTMIVEHDYTDINGTYNQFYIDKVTNKFITNVTTNFKPMVMKIKLVTQNSNYVIEPHNVSETVFNTEKDKVINGTSSHTVVGRFLLEMGTITTNPVKNIAFETQGSWVQMYNNANTLIFSLLDNFNPATHKVVTYTVSNSNNLNQLVVPNSIYRNLTSNNIIETKFDLNTYLFAGQANGYLGKVMILICEK